jgi:prohead serine protease
MARGESRDDGLEEGTFTAVISTEHVDREKDVVDPAGMVRPLRAWQGVGKMIPLIWNSGAPEDHVGHILPASVKAVDGEVHVDGWIDREAERGKAAWRVIKSGTAGFSFGYLIKDSTERADGGRLLTEIDVFEVSVTITPMNGHTRGTSWKSTEEPDRAPPSLGELHRREREIELELGVVDPDVDKFRRATRDAIFGLLNSTNDDGHEEQKTASALRERADRVAAELAPVKVASFEC